jgi:hypothetical protein
MLESKANAIEKGNQKESLFEKFMGSQYGTKNCKLFIYNELSPKRINKNGCIIFTQEEVQ